MAIGSCGLGPPRSPGREIFSRKATEAATDSGPEASRAESTSLRRLYTSSRRLFNCVLATIDASSASLDTAYAARLHLLARPTVGVNDAASAALIAKARPLALEVAGVPTISQPCPAGRFLLHLLPALLGFFGRLLVLLFSVGLVIFEGVAFHSCSFRRVFGRARSSLLSHGAHPHDCARPSKAACEAGVDVAVPILPEPRGHRDSENEVVVFGLTPMFVGIVCGLRVDLHAEV